MSMPPDDLAESPTEEVPRPAEPLPGNGRWRLVALLANDGHEPAAGLSEHAALAAWCATTAAWHPALLAVCAELPRLEDVETPSSPEPNEIRILAEGTEDRLPSGYRTQAEDAGTVVLEGSVDRDALVRMLTERLGAGPSPGLEEGEIADPVALDFLALGLVRWWLRDLAIAMGHVEGLDAESLTREVLAGAAAWQRGDRPTALNRLRAAFEVLTQARERFYPVDSYLLDLCLFDPATPTADLADSLTASAPVTLLAPARAIEALARRDPLRLSALREAINEGRIDVVGGVYEEVDEPLLPLESIYWQFRRGGEVYREHLDNRNVETVARRRFGLYPQLPQIAKRFGFRFAVHLGFDAGRFPVRPESKRLWESLDGTTLETLTRPPLGADRAAEGLHLPWRLARSMRDDHVATAALAHWPSPVAAWYLDLRRAAAYSPVLARWVTLNDYFHLTDRPFETFRPELDQYVTPYLEQAAARRDPGPITRRAEHARLRARLDALAAAQALARAITSEVATPTPEGPALAALEAALETGRLEEAHSGLELLEPFWAGALARGIVGAGTGERRGFLVLNPLGTARRAAVVLPDADADLRPEGPLRAAQLTEEGVVAVVELPAYGFAWLPRDTNFEHPPSPQGAVSARGRTLRNESVEVEIDANTGGILSLLAPGEKTARLGQQLVVTGLSGPDAPPVPSSMRSEAFEVDYAGPALVQAFSRGSLVETRTGRRLAGFHQRYRLWTGRPLLELDITLSDIDAEWLAAAAQADPWAHFLSCRWAWPDPGSMLRRTSLLAAELTEAERPETPDALDISTRRQRTALIFGGLAHHRRHGTRMLDTLLIAGSETGRSFRLGVALDLEYPFQAASDLVTPAFVVPTDVGPPAAGPTGWLFQVDNKAVAVTRVDYADLSDEGQGWGLVFHLVETAGRSHRCRLRTFRDPVWARQVDYQGELIVDLTVDGDSALIDLTPNELVRVVVTLG